MKNYIKSGQNKTFTAGADLVSGQVHQVGDYIGIVAYDVLNGEEGELAITGVFSVPKVAATAFSDGDIAYWDGSQVTNVNTDALLGTVDKAAASADAEIQVLLKAGPRAFN